MNHKLFQKKFDHKPFEKKFDRKPPCSGVINRRNGCEKKFDRKPPCSGVINRRNGCGSTVAVQRLKLKEPS
ncbi:MAG: hypothetical protein PHG79_10205 [Methanosarcina sp.]|nr:hypothetical protein [Methanosarcina sp.]MDD3874734.1 hypothetical protein [Methanosarcina sp.]MDD4522671.1 hypothetical protein [Methanosarcina sp.]